MAWKKEIQGGERGGGQKGIWDGTEIEKINVIKMKETSCSACLKYRYIEQYCWLNLERASYSMFHRYRSTRPSFPFSINPLAFERSTKSSNL